MYYGIILLSGEKSNDKIPKWERKVGKVYGLYNRTKKQRYYGSTTRSVEKRLQEHAASQTGATAHWNFKKDKIYHRTIAKGLSPQKATEKAHELESCKPPRWWKTLQTGGK